MKTLELLFLLTLISLSTFVFGQKPELILPIGHTKPVFSAQYNPDGKYIVTASGDGTAKIWESSSGKLLHSIEGYSAIFSPDGNYIVTTSRNYTVKIWESCSGKLLHSLGEHTRFDKSAQFSPDSKYIVTVRYNTAKIWESSSGKLLHSLEGHTNDVRSAEFSPDGKYIVTVSGKTVKIWESSSGKLLDSLEGHTDLVLSAEFSPDGKYIVTNSNDGTVKIWECSSGKLLHSLEGRYPHFSPDSKYIVIVSKDKTAKIWESNSGKLLYNLEHTLPNLEPAWINSAQFSPDGKYIVTTSGNYTVKIWESSSGKLLHSLEGYSAEFSPDGKYIVTASHNTTATIWDRTAKIWECSSGRLLLSLKGDYRHFSPDGKYIVTASEDRTAKIWECSSGELLYSLEGHTGRINSAQFNPDGKYIVTASSDNTAKIWESSSGKLLHSIKGRIYSKKYVQFSPDGKYIVTASNDSTAKIWETGSGKLLHSLEGNRSSVELAQFSPDGNYIVTASWDNTVKIWESSNGKLLDSIEGHTGRIISAQFSPDSKYVVTLSIDETAKIWECSSGKLLQSLGHDDYVNSAQFSPDGKYIVTASGDNTAKIWECSKGKLLKRLKGHNDYVHSALFSPDGTHIVTASGDETAKIWEFSSGELLYSLEGHSDGVNFAQFNPDGKYIVTASYDKTAKIWDAENGKLIRTIDIKGLFYDINWNTQHIISQDNSRLFLYDLQTGNELLSWIAVDSTDWAVISPSGLFDASPGAMEKMYFVQGLEVIELNQLKDRYYEPGLWGKIMGSNTEPLRDVNGLDEIKLSPAIQLSISGNVLNISLEDRGGGIGKYMIFINGKEVYTGNQTKDDIQFRGGTTLKSSFDLKDHPYMLPGVENEIEVKAYNGENYILSRGEKIMYKQAGTLSSEQPRLFILTAGVSDYTGDQLDLKYAAKDAEDITLALTIGAKNLFGADKTFIYKMTTADTCKAHWPTKENIKKAFADISKEARSSDVIVVYLSGHGIDWGGQDGDFYYLTQDAWTGTADAYNDPGIRAKTTISSAELTELIKGVAALKQVLIIDACGSGKAVENLMAKRDISSSTLRALDRMKDRTGLHIITGCAADAVSYEASKYGQGVLTYSLLEGIKGASLREEKFVDVLKLFQYCAERVPLIAGGIGGIQQPQIFSPYGESGFDIGEILSADKSLIPLSRAKPMFLMCSLKDEETFDDILEIEKKVDDALRDISAKGNNSNLIFIEAKDFPEAYKIRGQYKVEGENISVKVNVFKGKEMQASYTVTGSKTAIDKLAEEIVKKAEEVVK